MKQCILAFLPLLLLLSCSSGTTPEAQETKDAVEQPSMILRDVTYVTSWDAGEPLTITASTITLDDKTNEAVIQDFSFSRTDGEGKTDLWGSAKTATVNTQTHDATLSGDVVVHKETDQFAIHAPNLRWNDAEQLLSTGEQDLADICFHEGDAITGRGFSGDLKTNTFEFVQLVQGVVQQ
jgi:LPS export ABC transporter protein LptC